MTAMQGKNQRNRYSGGHRAGLEPQPGAACGGSRQRLETERKRLWQDCAGFCGLVDQRFLII